MDTVNTSFFTREMFSDNLNVGVMEIENLLGPAVRSKLYTFADTNEYVFIDSKAVQISCYSLLISKFIFIFSIKCVSQHKHCFKQDNPGLVSRIL